MNIWQNVKSHLGKILASIGTAIAGFDLAQYAAEVSGYAGQYLDPKYIKPLNLVFFVLLIIRTTWTGWQHPSKG